MRCVKVHRILLLALAVPVLVYAFSSGPPQAHTGGFGEPTCTECHVGTGLNAGPGKVEITPPPSYESGVTYPITVRVSDPNQRRWGFELSVRTTPGGQQAGTLIVGTDGFTQRLANFNSIQYISHTSVGTRAGTTTGASFTFSWTAPDVSVGPVVFHAAGNAANASFSELGDRIYATSVTVQPQSAAPAPSVVADSDIMNNASYRLASPNVAPGTIAAIFGANLTDGSSCLQAEGCDPTFDSNGRLNTTLAGAQVLVNGTPAPILYAAPFQIGIQVPTELTGTSVTVQVKVGTQTSASRTIILDAVSPGIFTANAQGTGSAAITHGNGSAVTPQNPARPGETVILWATGLGQVSPAVPTGALPTGESRTVNPVTVTIDGIAVIPGFAGLSGCCAGLNQVNLTLPTNTRSGNDIPVVLTIGGKQSNPATIAVASP